jgi:hypothetical protein
LFNLRVSEKMLGDLPDRDCRRVGAYTATVALLPQGFLLFLAPRARLFSRVEGLSDFSKPLETNPRYDFYGGEGGIRTHEPR